MKDNEQTKRELIANTVLAGIVVVIVASVAVYHYFDGILREFFFR